MQSKILLLLNQSKDTMLTIAEIAKQINVETTLVKEELVKLKEMNCIRSSCQDIKIEDCWFCIKPRTYPTINLRVIWTTKKQDFDR